MASLTQWTRNALEHGLHSALRYRLKGLSESQDKDWHVKQPVPFECERGNHLCLLSRGWTDGEKLPSSPGWPSLGRGVPGEAAGPVNLGVSLGTWRGGGGGYEKGQRLPASRSPVF